MSNKNRVFQSPLFNIFLLTAGEPRRVFKTQNRFRFFVDFWSNFDILGVAGKKGSRSPIFGKMGSLFYDFVNFYQLFGHFFLTFFGSFFNIFWIFFDIFYRFWVNLSQFGSNFWFLNGVSLVLNKVPWDLAHFGSILLIFMVSQWSSIGSQWSSNGVSLDLNGVPLVLNGVPLGLAHFGSIWLRFLVFPCNLVILGPFWSILGFLSIFDKKAWV